MDIMNFVAKYASVVFVNLTMGGGVPVLTICKKSNGYINLITNTEDPEKIIKLCEETIEQVRTKKATCKIEIPIIDNDHSNN